MIIDSPIISGSSAASGSLNQFGNVTITGSLTVTGPIIGVLTGSVNSASFATTASYVSPNTQINTASFAITASYVSPNTQINTSSFSITSSYASTVDFNNTVATSSFAFTASYVSPNTQINTASFAITASYVSPNTQINTASFAITASYVSPNTQINTASFAVTASYVSPNTQINTASFATTASYATNAETLDGLDSSVFTLTSSFQNYTSSNDARIASINAFSASILNYTSSTDAKVNALYAFSSSLLSYTSSTDAKIASIYSTTASLNDSVASLNTYTSSNTMNIANLFATSASLNANVAGLNAQTASLLSYTSSNDAINTSQNTRLSALEAATASLYATTASLNASVASLNTYTSSLNAKTASFATTGSNTFTGRQYISDASQASSFTSTASIYTDGGMRVTRDAYVSGTLFLNNLTVFGTQSVAYISSSQLNIATNIITVNTSTPTIRFGGLAVQDSGSGATGLTGSILWDSQDNQWIYSNPSGSTYDSAVFLVGPRSTGALGSEVGITTNALAKGDGLHHMTSSGIFESGSGDVGIGTTSPNFTTTNRRVLDINGTSTSLIALSVGGTAKAYIYHGGTDFSVANYTNGGSLGFNTNDGTDRQRMTIISNGNVGIGTTNPSYPLMVYRGGGSFDTIAMNGDIGYNVGLGIYKGGSQKWAVYSSNIDTFNIYSTGLNRDVFSILSGSGNVGIGTTSPTAKLDIAVSVASGNFLGDANIYALAVKNNDTTAGNAVGITFGQGGFTYTNFIASVRTTTGSNPAGDLVFGGRPSDGASFIERLRITAGGNVGIGTTNPTYTLDVSGNGRFTGNILISKSNDATVEVNSTTAASYSAFFHSESGTAKAYWEYVNSTFSDSTRRNYLEAFNSVGGFSVYTAGAKALDINTAGTATFSGKTNIVKSHSDYAFTVVNTDTGGYGIYLQAGSSTTDRNAIDVYNAAGTTQIFKLTGTGLATFANSVESSDGFQGRYYRIREASSNRGGLYPYNLVVGSGTDYSIGIFSEGEIFLASGGSATKRLVMNSSGNVGIGSTSPGYKLDVAGIGGFSSNVYAGGANGVFVTSGRGVVEANGSSQAIFGLTIGNAAKAYMYHDGSNLAIYSYTGATYLSNSSGTILTINGANVGIGTTSPATKLTVYAGSGTISGTNDAIRLQVASYNNAARNTIVWHQDGGDTILARYGLEWNSSTTNMNFVWRDVYANNATGSTELMRLQGNGNLGIGTTSPGQALDVNGKIRLRDGGNTTVPSIQMNAGGTMGFSNPSNEDISIITASTTKVFIKQDGNIGIGSTSPTAKLDIAGSGGGIILTFGNTVPNYPLFINTYGGWSGIGMDQSTAGLRLAGDYSGGTSLVDIGYYSGGSVAHANWVSRMKVLNGGNVGIGTTNPTNLLHTAGASATPSLRLGSVSAGYHWDIGRENATTGDFVFNNANGGSTTEKVRITVGGYVGIGTSNPLSRFHIKSLGNGYNAYLGEGGTTAASILPYDGEIYISAGTYYEGSTWVFKQSAGASLFSISETAGTSWWSGTGTSYSNVADSVKLWNQNGYWKNLVQSNQTGDSYFTGGNVGIGTTSPNNNLHINGNGAGFNFSGGNNRIYFNSSRAIEGNGTNLQIGEGHSTTYLQTSTNGIILTVTGANVGIGTISPSSRLHVSGSGGRLVRIEGPSNQDNYLSIFSGGIEMFMDADYTNSSGIVGTQSGHNLILRTNGDNRVWITTGGNVGIGTSSPGQKLQVEGSLLVNTGTAVTAFRDIMMGGIGGWSTGESHGIDTVYNAASNPTTFTRIESYFDGSSASMYFRNFFNNSSSQTSILMTIRGNGNVGIGSTSPAYTLDVSGTIRATGDVIAFSDARVKDNVQTVENALSTITSLRGVTYTRNDNEDKSRKVGVIAQEVLPILPEVVQQDDNGNYSVAYGNIVGVLIEAIKEQQQQIDELKYLLQTINK